MIWSSKNRFFIYSTQTPPPVKTECLLRNSETTPACFACSFTTARLILGLAAPRPHCEESKFYFAVPATIAYLCYQISHLTGGIPEAMKLKRNAQAGQFQSPAMLFCLVVGRVHALESSGQRNNLDA